MEPPVSVVDAASPAVGETPATPTPRRVQASKKMQARLTASAVLCVTGFVALLVWVALRYPPIPDKKNVAEERFCCPEEAAHLFSVVDKTISPCKDFFAHVCKKALDEGIVKQSVGRDILANIAAHLTKGTDFYESSAAANLHRFYTSCMREIWQPERRFRDCAAAVLEIANFETHVNATYMFRTAMNMKYRYRLPFFFTLISEPGQAMTIETNHLRLKDYKFFCAEDCLNIILSVVNAHFGTSYRLEEVIDWERRFPNILSTATFDVITPEELHYAFNGLDISEVKAIAKEYFKHADVGNSIKAPYKDFLLDEVRLLWEPSYQPLSLCHVVMSVSVAAILPIQIYSVLDSPTPQSAMLCLLHGEKFKELWRRTHVAALTSREKNTQLRNVFEATRHAFAVYAPLRKIMAAGGDAAKFQAFVRNISLLLPVDVIVPDIPEPHLSTEGFMRNLFRTMSFEFDVRTAMWRRGIPAIRGDLMGTHKEVMQFVDRTALYVPPIAFAVLSSNTTDPMLADAAVIASRMAALLWNQLVSGDIWSQQTKNAIELYSGCVVSSIPRLDSYHLPLVVAATVAVQIAAAASVGAFTSSSIEPGTADWHTPKAAWSFEKMSNAQFFYLRYTYFQCSLENEAALFVNTALKLNRDFAIAFGCRAYDHIRTSLDLCSLLGTGIAGIFGPSSDVTSMHVQSICDALDVPHIEMRWDFQLQRDDLSINLFPKPAVLAKAYVDLIKTWGWNRFALVYEDHEGIIRLQDFLKEARGNDWHIQMYQFHTGQPYRDLFWKIKKTKETRVVLDVKRENLFTALKHDLHTVDLEEFKYGQTKITGYRLVDVDSPELQGFLKDWEIMSSRMDRKAPVPQTIRTETALMYDAVKLFAMGLHQLDLTKAVDFPVISCDMAVSSSDGSSLINLMKPITLQGLTGEISFDPQGFRSSFSLDIMALKSDGLQKVGHWTPRDNVTVEDNVTSDYDSLLIKDKTLVVTTVLTDPYMMLKESAADLQGNDRFEGYCVDLLKELSKQLNFKYEIRLVKDKAYGIQNASGNWNGMIGEVVSGKADLAIADLTITSKREVAVDFTMPFMNTGISILFKKPTQKVTTLFSFLSPFSMEVWAYVVGAYIGVSVVLFLVGRLSPYEWDNPHPCRQNDQVLENSFSLLNSLWFTIGSLMQQGSDLAPKAMSTRTVAGIWYFFTLIMISSYTANLAAFLTVEKTVYPIENAEDLAKQNKIKYGCLRSGSTRAFFNESKIPTYKKMHKYMLDHEAEVYMETSTDGVNRVKAGDYAFLMESASIEYIIERDCNLTQIGGLLDNKGYGIVTKKKSPYRQILSSGILKLQEAGKLHSFKEKWWKERKGGGKCVDDAKKSSAVTELSLANVGGVFVVLLGGLGLASIVAVIEFFFKAKKMAKEDSVSLCKEMMKQLKFAISCRSSTMPVKGNKPPEVDSNGGDYRISTLPSFTSDF